MCGITGAIWTEASRAIGPEVLRRMTDALAHRGPDDAGSYTSACKLNEPYGAVPGVALGHRRLSIIDVAGGHQPLSNEDGTVWVTYNGEIYNFLEIHDELVKL